jgi:hypothetical protein
MAVTNMTADMTAMTATTAVPAMTAMIGMTGIDMTAMTEAMVAGTAARGLLHCGCSWLNQRLFSAVVVMLTV